MQQKMPDAYTWELVVLWEKLAFDAFDENVDTFDMDFLDPICNGSVHNNRNIYHGFKFAPIFT